MKNSPATTPPAEPDYVARVNRAIDLVIANLDSSLPLDRLAKAANFSPFHFHRIFQALVGETPGQFVKRVRLERALRIMSHDPKRPLTHVALDCGFTSSSDFSRAFKRRFGSPPRAFDLESWRSNKNDELQRLVEDQAAGPHVLQLPVGANPDMDSRSS